MADSWIKMRTNLFEDPRVVRLGRWLARQAECYASRTVPADVLRDKPGDIHGTAQKQWVSIAVGLLHTTWSWVHTQGEADGLLVGVDEDAFDAYLGMPGWLAQLVAVEWMVVTPRGVKACDSEKYIGSKKANQAKEREKKRAQRASPQGHGGNVPAMSPTCPGDSSSSLSTTRSSSLSGSESERGTGGDPTPKSPRRAKHARCTLDEQLAELEFGTLRSDIVEACRAWAGYRREQGHRPWGPATWRTNLRRAVTHPEGFCAEVQHSIRQGYQGLFPPSHANGSAKPARQTASVANAVEAAREAAALLGEDLRGGSHQ